MMIWQGPKISHAVIIWKNSNMVGHVPLKISKSYVISYKGRQWSNMHHQCMAPQTADKGKTGWFHGGFIITQWASHAL